MLDHNTVSKFNIYQGKRNYALSIKHNIEFIDNIPELELHGISKLLKIHPDLIAKFTEIIGGHFQATQEGAIYFIPEGTKTKLSLGEASSAVRSLMVIWFWLQHQAKPGDILMMDEPELNLHPANQRRLARFLAALVNAGIKVFITTHSDYIIREFNTLIMLSSNKPHFVEVKAKFKDYAGSSVLNAEQVAVYSTRSALFSIEGKKKRALTLEQWPVAEHKGIQIQSFDDEINAMNRVQDALLYGVS